MTSWKVKKAQNDLILELVVKVAAPPGCRCRVDAVGWNETPPPKIGRGEETPSRTLSGPVLRDTARLSQQYPPIARYGVFGVSTWPIGCDTPSPFSERFPLVEHAKWSRRCDTPPPLTRGISAILARYPLK